MEKKDSNPNKDKDNLRGTNDQIGKDLQKIRGIGVDHVILNFNRSPISDNIDSIIDLSKHLSGFIR